MCKNVNIYWDYKYIFGTHYNYSHIPLTVLNFSTTTNNIRWTNIL